MYKYFKKNKEEEKKRKVLNGNYFRHRLEN